MATEADLEYVLDADRLIELNGPRPAVGQDWHNVTVCYRAVDGRAGRAAAVTALKAKLAGVLGAFAARVGSLPREVRCVVLSGWWIRETLHDGVVFVDGCFTLNRRGDYLRTTDLGERKAGKAWFVLLGETACPSPCEPEADEPVLIPSK